MAEELIEQLGNKTAFTIHVFGIDIPIADSCVVTWIIMAVLVLLSIILTRNLKKVPTGAQCVLEAFIDLLDNFFTGVLGESGKKYVHILETFIIYIGAANIIGVFGFVPPTKDVNVTAALAGMAIILVQAAFIIKKGPVKWLKSLLNPINLLDLMTRPLSLCMRLFGNVLGAFVIMKLLEAVVPVVIPAVFSIYFDLFDGILQAYVFVFLTSLYIKEEIEEEEEGEKKKKTLREKLVPLPPKKQNAA